MFVSSCLARTRARVPVAKACASRRVAVAVRRTPGHQLVRGVLPSLDLLLIVVAVWIGLDVLFIAGAFSRQRRRKRSPSQTGHQPPTRSARRSR